MRYIYAYMYVYTHMYVGMTPTTLSRRLTCHLAAGALKDYFRMYHGETSTRPILEDNAKILDIYRDQ